MLQQLRGQNEILDISLVCIEICVECRGGYMKNLGVLAAAIVVLFLCSTAHTTGWSRNGEFLIDTTLTYIHAPNDQRDPAVAFDGTNFLVVWPDGRFSYNVIGTRVTQSGTVVDSTGLIITGVEGFEHAALTFDGTNYFLCPEGDRSRWRCRSTGSRLWLLQ